MRNGEKRVCILDYGSGNVRSVYNLVTSISPSAIVSNQETDIESATHIILPGVGAFGAAMRKIKESLPISALERAILAQKKPFLGICIGMQVLGTKGLEFGEHEGLGWIPGIVRRLGSGNLPLPHIGWNDITVRRQSPLLEGLGENPDFYYVHSFVFQPSSPESIAATTSYGEDFCAVIQKDNILGVQFHPEKSQHAGRTLVHNFLRLG